VDEHRDVMRSSRVYLFAALFGPALFSAAPLPAQDPTVEPAVAQPAAPSPAQVEASYRALQESVSVAEAEVRRLGIPDALRTALDEAQLRQREIIGMLEILGALEHTRPERFSRVRDRALAEEQRLDQLLDRISGRASALGALQASWLEAQTVWTAWRQAAPQTQIPQIDRAIGSVEAILDLIEEAMQPIAALEEEAQRLRSANRVLIDRVTALRAGRREALLRAEQPILFSPAHLESLRSPEAWQPGEAVRPEAVGIFLRDHAGILLLHLLAVLVLGLLARRVRPHTAPEAGWSGLLTHPWAFAIFAATAMLARRYILAPPLWDVVVWSLLAGSVAVLASTLMRGRPLRLMIVSVAVVYPLILLGEALRVPAPIFRLVLAGAATAAVVAFPLLTRQADPTRASGRRARIVLGIATALSAAVLLAQVLGFDQLSRWLVHAMLTSAYVVFTVAFLLILARGSLQTLLRQEFVGRARLVGSVAVPLVERLVGILQIVLVVIGGLVILDIWELAPSPAETWGRIAGAGVQIAGLRITVERILVAVFLVYLAVTASWFVRTVVSQEISRSWSVERGVAESINALVHYAVITLGVLFGLGALGVELQNFAIVAGALGVGIGFGLQNVVNNFVSGIILLFERPIRAGDTVEIDGEWGTIKKIGLRSTVVVTFTQSELIVPNADLVSQKVTNWTLTNPMTRMAIPVGVAYGSDVQKVLEILTGTGHVHPAIVDEPPPMALFTGFGDSSLDFELRIWVSDISFRLLAKSAVLSEIDRRFREEGIEIPFPQRDLHLRTLDPSIVEGIRIGDTAHAGHSGSGDGDRADG
jgi:potassium-dependent mechanosensitive channel